MNHPILNPRIEILPEHIIDQIKAGEVLERPASLVKELIENSLDANSTEINIQLIENGLDLLSIEDNGNGMSFTNLPYAFVRHATSKLKSYEDLFHLHSFGFRGEALASVAASARLTCTSTPNDTHIEGGKIIINGGSQELLIPYRSNSHGTAIYIKDLFYNTPARLKFIKSKVSERSALKKMLYAFVLSHPQVYFSFKWDDKEREIFKETTPLLRTQQVFFAKLTKEVEESIWFAEEIYENYKVRLFFTPTTHTTPQYRHHYLFSNGRFFQDKSLHQAILRTLDPLWKHGESGHYAVHISTPLEDIDVNVHPNKTQIKFLKSDVIYSLLVSALKTALKKHHTKQITPSLNLEQNSFLTREEGQLLDLQNMDARSTQHFAHWQSENKTSPPQTSNHHILGYIDQCFILMKKNDCFYIGNIKTIMANYLTHSIEQFIAQEENTGPLLISEPFKIKKGKIDVHFEDLKMLGLEFDRLNSEVIALRTLPRFIPQALSRDIIHCLISFFEQSKIKKINFLEFSLFVESHWKTDVVIQDYLLMPIIELAGQQENGPLILLSEKNLKGLLK